MVQTSGLNNYKNLSKTNVIKLKLVTKNKSTNQTLSL